MADLGQAVVFDGALRVIERPRPVPAADEAVIQLRLAGICQTDLELMQGYKSFSGVLGHEFTGVVVVGPAEWLGRRVVGEINIGCGACDLCKEGIPSQCRSRRALGIQDYDGAFAEEFCLPVRNLAAVPDTVPDEAAVFVEPLAAACQVVEQVHLHPTDRVVVLGAGRLGLLVAQVVRQAQADPLVIARRDQQVALLERWGIRHTRAAETGRADVVIDCTGQADGLAAALDLVRPRGTIVLKSTYHSLPQADLTRIVVDEITLVGSRCGPFAAALHLLEQGLVDVLPLIEARYPLGEAARALDHAGRRGVLKVLLEPTRRAGSARQG